MSTRTRTDYLLWGALGCALVGTAHAEYTLATAVGVHWMVAAAVPGALDLYVIRALQVHRDVFLAVLVMTAANVASYLVQAGDLPVGWPLRSAVGALAPLILWRVHSLRYARTRKELLWGLKAGAVDAPEYDEPETHLVEDEEEVQLSAPVLKLVPKVSTSAPEPDADWLPDFLTQHSDADWLPDFLAQQVHPSTPAPAPLIPPLPVEYAPEAQASTPHSGYLNATDYAYLNLATEYVATTAAPSVRGLKEYAGVGQDRASRLLKHLKEET